MPSNLASDEHDAIAWFAAEALARLKVAHGAYLDLLHTALSLRR
jgi:hypothetical protein